MNQISISKKFFEPVVLHVRTWRTMSKSKKKPSHLPNVLPLQYRVYEPNPRAYVESHNLNPDARVLIVKIMHHLQSTSTNLPLIADNITWDGLVAINKSFLDINKEIKEQKFKITQRMLNKIAQRVYIYVKKEHHESDAILFVGVTVYLYYFYLEYSPGFFYIHMLCVYIYKCNCSFLSNIYDRDMGTYLGQNFLIDAKIRTYIADKISSLYVELGCVSLIEIGPGKGSITKLIQNISDNFFFIDKDSTFYDNGKLEIEHGTFILGDVLDVDINKLLSDKKLYSLQTLIVGNLPYYITSPILRQFFGYGKQEYAGGIFMVQEEVAQRLRSDAHKKSYLRRLLNYAYEVTYLKGVPAKCFKPAPKVKSALIQLHAKHEVSSILWQNLVDFLEMYAPFSRKTLGSISKMVDKRAKDMCHISDCFSSFVIPLKLQNKRLEELTWQDLENILIE